MKKKTKLELPHYWICEFCALDKGGTWPKGHCATVTFGLCEYCKTKEITIIPIVDFNWPDRDLSEHRD